MADLTVTAANVSRAYGGERTMTAGATITAGQPVYRNPTDGKAYPAKSDTAQDAACKGIALNGASAGQTVTIQTSGVINIGATVAVGAVYCVSGNAGGIAPNADVVATDYVTLIGIGITTAQIQLGILPSGVAHA